METFLEVVLAAAEVGTLVMTFLAEVSDQV